MASVLPVPDRRLTRLAAREPAHRLSVDEYHRMLEAGILDEDDRVELLEGVIVRMSPRSPPHAHVIQRLTRHLNRTLGDEYVVLPQLPLTLGDFSEPEPDLAVVRAEDAASAEEHPRTACLVIEVAKATLRKDRQLKAGLYARFAIPEYWIFNMKERCVEVHRDPDPDAGRLPHGAHLRARRDAREQRGPRVARRPRRAVRLRRRADAQSSSSARASRTPGISVISASASAGTG